MCIRVRSLGERLDGTYAQYVKVLPENCFPIPSYMTFDEAAAFPLVFVTLWRMLVTNARLQPGESLLIIGIGGGVASAALQVARRMGAQVIVTSGSDEKLERAKALGADHGINHRQKNYRRRSCSVDGQSRRGCRSRQRSRRSLAEELALARARRAISYLRRDRGRRTER